MPPVPNTTKPPTGPPVGAPVDVGLMSPLLGSPGWGTFVQDSEHVPEWQWPSYTQLVERMLGSDGQVWALFMGTVLPLLEYDWWIDPNGADAEFTGALAADLGLTVADAGGPAERGGEIKPGLFRFSFTEHLWEALLALAFGHYYFEQVATDPTKSDDGLAHLRKLDPRPPVTIAEILLDSDGGLRAIRQNFGKANRRADLGVHWGIAQPIPVERLVGYVWLPDGRRRWIGRSMLRPIYGSHLVQDRLMRVDAINHERAGGIPVVETDERYQGTSLTELRDLASQVRVGEEAGAAMPAGSKLNILRAGGTDVVGSMRYHDERMARAWGQMLRQLGQTITGSRALGEEFGDVEALVRRSIARWFAGTFREHVVEDWWAWNVPLVNGVPSQHPLLRYRPPVLEGSDEPQAPGGAPAAVPPPRASARQRSRAPVAAAAELALPARPLRRQPYPHEIAAAVDFAALDAVYVSTTADVEALWASEWLPQALAAVSDGIRFTKAGDPRKRVTRSAMARLTVPEPQSDRLALLLLGVARTAAEAAAGELMAQGQDVLIPSDEHLALLVADHAQAVARQTADGLALAASRRAVQLSQGRTPDALAGEVVEYLGGLAHKWERDQLAGAVQQASNAGRFAVFDRVPSEAAVGWHASELLDENTCGPCVAVDGREFESLAAAMREYPSGGFSECKGGPRCRGTVVAVLAEDEVDSAEREAFPGLWGEPV